MLQLIRITAHKKMALCCFLFACNATKKRFLLIKETGRKTLIPQNLNIVVMIKMARLALADHGVDQEF